MKAITLLSIVPIAVGAGACAADERDPGDALAAQAMQVTDTATSLDTAARPEWVRINSISWAGSGCPAGSVAEDLSADLSTFTLLFDSYVAEIGPGLPLSLGRRNCQILVDLEFPQGWSFSVFDVDYRGFVNLEAGVSGVQQSAYYFQGEYHTARLATTLRGPRVEDYQIRDSLALDSLVWSPCGDDRALIINSAIRLVNNSSDRNARGLMTTDSIDGKVTHIYGLQWRHCTR